MEKQFTIRMLDNSYSNAVVQLILPIQIDEFHVPITLADQPDLLQLEENYHRTGGGVWGAVAGEELIGTIALIGVNPHIGAIRKMFVKKEYRGKETGVAQALLNELVEYARRHHITHLYLGTVEMLKAAHRFYEKNGFERLAKTSLPASFPAMAADTIFYQLTIQSYAHERN
ncbi:MAG: GNAT family N-acetyltransferase [Agriterribacter sp.]